MFVIIHIQYTLFRNTFKRLMLVDPNTSFFFAFFFQMVHHFLMVDLNQGTLYDYICPYPKVLKMGGKWDSLA